MDWRYNTIWFEELDQSRVINLDLRTCSLPILGAEQYVSLRGYRQKNGVLDTFPISEDVLYLELSLSNLRSFGGLGRLRSLRRLELVHCYKLDSDSGLDEVAGSIRHLHILNSKRFTVGSGIKSLRDIQVLRLNECGEIDDLEFLHELPNLIDFRFVNTNVRSGDLSPLLEHKTLRSVGFLDKRHYNLKSDAVEQALEAKSSQPFQQWVHKGTWKTFRFLDADEDVSE